jgi:hypothetical protein
MAAAFFLSPCSAQTIDLGPSLEKSPKKGDAYHSVLSKDNQKKVNDAVEKGVRFLMTQQSDNGSWPGNPTVGYAALPALTLLECGMAPNDPIIKKAADVVRKNTGKLTQTYEISLAILFLDRLGEKKDKDMIRFLAMRLIAGQQLDGGWTYGCPELTNNIPDYNSLVNFLHATRPTACIVTGNDKKPFIPISKAQIEQYQFFISTINKDNPKQPDTGKKPVDKKDPGIVLPFDPVGPGKGPKLKPGEKLDPKPVEPVFKPFKVAKLAPTVQSLPIVKVTPALKVNGRKGAMGNAASDNSNTQFAMMALWVARKHNVPIEKTMALVEQRFVNSQKPDGTWTYQYNGGHANGAMLCVGLIGLAVGHGAYKESIGEAWVMAATRSVKEDPQIQDGLKALTTHIGEAPADWKTHAPQTPQGLYFLWSVERVAMLYNLKSIGGKEWYPWAAHQLVVNQQPNGQWANGGYHGSSAILDTSLALLILKRANFIPDLTESLHQDSILIRYPGKDGK